jgi:hypothetical protein
MAAKFFTGLPLDGPDPECVQGYGELALASVASAPKPSGDHSHSPASAEKMRAGPVPLTLSSRRPDRACDQSPVSL